MPRRKQPKRKQKAKNPQRNTPRPSQNEEPVAQATQEAPTQNALNSIWRGIKKAVILAPQAYLAYAVARTAWLSGQPNCYGYALNEPTNRYNVPGDIAGQPAQERTCSAILDGVKADGAKEPLSYAPDGCSVTCPPSTHPVYAVVGDVTWDVLGVPVPLSATDVHFYKEDGPGRYSHKPGKLAPTDRDGSNRLINCPPEANHVYTHSMLPLLPFPIPRETLAYATTPDKHCGFICVLDSAQDKHALSSGKASKEDIKSQNNRGR